MNRFSTAAASIFAVLALGACNNEPTTSPLSDNAATGSLTRSDDRNKDDNARRDDDDDDRNDDHSTGTVFVLSNQVAGNTVLKFDRNADGSLTPNGSVSTNGIGTGAGLGSQGALTYSPDRDLLFVVNAGSNTVSSFRVHNNNLTLVSTIASGGIKPVSLTAHDGVLYVLNAGGTGNISGLRYSNNGTLVAIPNSSRALSSNTSDPAEVAFSEDGDRLIVTEKGANMIGSYNVASNGLASAGQFQPASGITPFGFAVNGDAIIVSEAFGGAANASAVSSYHVGRTGPLQVVSGSVATTETSACWIAVTGNGKLAFSANTGSGTVTAFEVARSGALSRIPPDGVSATIGAGTAPADLAVSHNNRYLYVRNGGNRSISAIRIHSKGALTVLGTTLNLPAGTAGLVAN